MKSNKVRNWAIAGVAGTLSAGQALAVGEFDLTTSTAILTGIAATAAILVGSIIALSAGMDAWQKIRGFFKRAK